MRVASAYEFKGTQLGKIMRVRITTLNYQIYYILRCQV